MNQNNFQDDKGNVINLSQVKKKRLTLGFPSFKKKNDSSQRGGPFAKPKSFSYYFWTIIQLVLLLALVTYLMRLCQP